MCLNSHLLRIPFRTTQMLGAGSPNWECLKKHQKFFQVVNNYTNNRKKTFFFIQAANKRLEKVIVGTLVLSKICISLWRDRLLEETSAMNFLCLNCGLLTETVDSFLLPTTKSLDADNCCIAWATVMLAHLHTFVWAMLLGHDLKILPWQRNFCICLLSGCSLRH